MRGWLPTRHAALVEAARTSEAVVVGHVRRTSPLREVRCTVFPDGRIAYEKPLHRLPRGFGA